MWGSQVCRVCFLKHAAPKNGSGGNFSSDREPVKGAPPWPPPCKLGQSQFLPVGINVCAQVIRGRLNDLSQTKHTSHTLPKSNNRTLSAGRCLLYSQSLSLMVTPTVTPNIESLYLFCTLCKRNHAVTCTTRRLT